MTQPPLWDDDPDPPARSRRRRVPRCDDCGRRVWSHDSLRVGPDGRRRGDKCRRKLARLTPRVRLALGRVRRMAPGPDQLTITDQEDM